MQDKDGEKKEKKEHKDKDHKDKKELTHSSSDSKKHSSASSKTAVAAGSGSTAAVSSRPRPQLKKPVKQQQQPADDYLAGLDLPPSEEEEEETEKREFDKGPLVVQVGTHQQQQHGPAAWPSTMQCTRAVARQHGGEGGQAVCKLQGMGGRGVCSCGAGRQQRVTSCRRYGSLGAD